MYILIFLFLVRKRFDSYYLFAIAKELVIVFFFFRGLNFKFDLGCGIRVVCVLRKGVLGFSKYIGEIFFGSFLGFRLVVCGFEVYFDIVLGLV